MRRRRRCSPTRLARPKLAEPAVSQPAQDHDWQSFVTLLIAPHPELTAAQARAIKIDYGIGRAALKIKVRRALLFYALKRLGLDVAADVRPPYEQHIVLLNRPVECGRAVESRTIHIDMLL